MESLQSRKGISTCSETHTDARTANTKALPVVYIVTHRLTHAHIQKQRYIHGSDRERGRNPEGCSGVQRHTHKTPEHPETHADPHIDIQKDV